MARKLNLEHIGRKSKKLIRDGLGVKNKKQLLELASAWGVHLGKRAKTQEDRAYKYFATKYNETIETEQVERKMAKIKMIKNQDRTFKFMSLERNLLKKPEYRNLFKSKVGKSRPYNVTLTSKVVEGVKRTFKVNDQQHLINWLDRVEADNYDNSGYTKKFLNEQSDHKNVFDLFSLQISPVKGGKGSGWGENRTKDLMRKIKIKEYACVALDPKTVDRGDNNCGIRVVDRLLGIKINVKQARKNLKCPAKTLLEPTHVHQLYTEHGGHKSLEFIDTDYDGEFHFDTTEYILIKDEHYTIIKEAKLETGRLKHKGKLAFDIETRYTDEVVMIGNTPSRIMKSAILSIVYQPARSKEKKALTFATDMKENCCEKFLDWLRQEGINNRWYNCVAHNGARFDFYLLMAYFPEIELAKHPPQLRGTSIIGMQYRSHTFKDPCCFLTNSLKNLCEGYLITPEEKKFCKMTNIKVGDTEMSNYQLCFYKPELGFWDFMNLEKSEPEFWEQYVKYCEYDCFSLFLVWEKFKEQIDTIIRKMSPWLFQSVSLNTMNTIGSLAKKLIDAINGADKRRPSAGKVSYRYYNKFVNNDEEKYDFVKNFKRGGISHCNQPGWHQEGVCGFDIKSQYPTALINMMMPVGESRWVSEYVPKAHGFYFIRNLQFAADAKKFKPVAALNQNGVCNWASTHMHHLYADSYMIKYLMKHCGLEKFEVSRGLVSDREMEGSKLFGTYVETLYKEKAKQDELKDKKLPFNKPYREAIKLLLNALTGKLVEDPSRYFQLQFLKSSGELSKDKSICINGTEIVKSQVEAGINPWLVAGVMVYSYSKRNLWEYVRCLPNGSDDVIHIETDGIYFGLPNKNKFVHNMMLKELLDRKTIIKIGESLGNVEQEVCTFEESFFLSKKDYLIGEVKLNPDQSINYKKCKMAAKGVPKTTITDDGSNLDLLDKKFYTERYNGNSVTKKFKTMSKWLYDTRRTNGITITGYDMSRETTPHEFRNYRTYFELDGGVVAVPRIPYCEHAHAMRHKHA